MRSVEVEPDSSLRVTVELLGPEVGQLSDPHRQR
jgi:hypothetical protein